MKWSWQMRAHMQRLHISEFKCKLCPLVTRSRHVALTHTKFHEVQKYICSHCGMHFENEPTMLSHVRLKHMSDCVCELCGYTFVGDNGVRAHKRLKHKFDDKNQPFEGPHCKVCDVKFLNQEAYDKHLQLSSKHLKSDGYHNRSADSNQRRKYKNDDEGFHIMTCEECGVKAAGVRGYTRHFRDAHPGLVPAQCHTHDAPYMCEHCGKMFTTVYLLKGHMWVHTGKKLFQCDICNKSFTAKLTLKEHIMRHESKHQNHECLLCGKQFVNKSNILRHFRVAHEGVRRFKCHVCDKSFASKVEMTAHVNHVHLNIPRPKRIRRRPKKLLK
ncbi:zinc finger protein 850-like isoform X1 [Spodoptera litura]|uniref:Zinc finger protein 850-like isoform X1 n=1 Tax=Spodoptera litura TaxID=69820 RepID=A0A9J7J2T3_SPOLT|nr:zinc finger protein 850-like isoform X1 [Spodoptera litura]